MRQMQEIKRELGDQYFFERLLSKRDVRRLIKLNPAKIEMQTVLSLTAGCVKIEMCLYQQNGKLTLGYDVFVKDNPASSEWICYDSLNDPVTFSEENMLSVLNRVVKENGLSYTECCFEKLDGKAIRMKRDRHQQKSEDCEKSIG